jgi:hypothetical protein
MYFNVCFTDQLTDFWAKFLLFYWGQSHYSQKRTFEVSLNLETLKSADW